MTNKPLISVVTVCYNAINSIEKTILSVVSQTYPNTEYIIIDGGSSDGTTDIIKKYYDRLAYWISEPDNGIFDAMNKSLKHLNGEWVIFMNAGDYFFNDNVISDVGFDKVCNDIGFVFGSYYGKYPFNLLRKMPIKPFYSNKSFYRGMGFTHQSVFVRTELAKKFGFDLSYKTASDYNQICLIYKAGYKPLQTNVFIAVMDMTDGFSQNNKKIQYEETARICGCHNDIRFKFILRYNLLKQSVKRAILYRK